MKRGLLLGIIFAVFYLNGLSGQIAQSVFVEGLGLGGVYSVNYDTRFTSSEENNGLGMRIGVEFFEDIAIFPAQLNYLIGKNGKYIEIGAGAIIITGVVEFAYGTTGF